jgi:hypothetical protein
MQCREKKIAASIAGENAAGPIRAVRPGRKPDDPYSGPDVPEPWHWLSPIFPICKRLAFIAGDLSTVIPQPRATTALDDF